MRHVADEAGFPRVAPDDLRPLVPTRRPAVAEEEAGGSRARSRLTEADEGAHRAQLVGGVHVPSQRLAGVPVAQLAPQ